ncbi:hypothetical protein [Pseudochrobactrum sp. AO18b]|uniref:hyaluronate lyase N-terminal domain-containing protein n=1 Tax=Pseudochrobactrum sp. AO18b TaxID=1201036 RepID=UPI000399C294|nr:hypothetical protein [Pseudochrobactrum sp. AO18b]
MSTEVRWRRGTAAQHENFAGALSEITHDTTKNNLRIHDGTKLGGFPTLMEHQLGVKNGVAPLDNDSRVPITNLRIGEADSLASLDSAGNVPLTQLGNVPEAIAGAFRTKLSTHVTINVTNTGDDEGGGLSSPFKTISACLNYIYKSLDLNSFSVVIKLADGVYPENIVVNSMPVGAGTITGAYPLTLSGNVSNPGNVRLGAGSGVTIQVINGGRIAVEGVQYVQSGYSNTANGSGSSIAIIGAVILDNQQYDHFASLSYANIVLSADYTVIGGAMNHIHATEGGSIEYVGTRVVTIQNNPDFWGQFAGCAFSVIKAINTTFTGSATGKRFLCHYNGEIRTETFNRNLFPGNIPGEVQSGGMYDYPPYTSFSLSTDASLPNATPTLVPFDVTNDNVNGMLLTDVKMQPLAGFASIEATLAFSGLTVGQSIYVIVRKNGVDYKVASKIAQAAFDSMSIVLSSVKCNGNDYFQVFTQVNGSGVSVRGGETLTYASARQL